MAASAPALQPALTLELKAATSEAHAQPAPTVAPRPPAVLQADEALAGTDFAPLSPYVATVAESFDAVLNTPHLDTEGVFIKLPRHFRDDLFIEMNLSHGPRARMMLVFPGVGDDGAASVPRQIGKIALDHGMNFAIIPNPWSFSWLDAKPRHLPGVLPAENRATVDVIRALQQMKPSYFDDVSAVGYSYGGMLGAATLREQQRGGGPQTINGTFTAVSPPVNILDSVPMMDKMGLEEPDPTSHVLATGIGYWSEIVDQGYDGFILSPLAQWGDDAAEQFMARHYGPQRVLRGTLSMLVPPPDVHSFDAFVHEVLPRDPWFTRHHSSVQAAAEAEQLDTMLDDLTGKGVPVMVLTSSDDLILTPGNVARLADEAAHPAPDQIIHPYAHGGHVGLLFNPRIRDVVGQFAAAPRTVPPPHSPHS